MRTRLMLFCCILAVDAHAEVSGVAADPCADEAKFANCVASLRAEISGLQNRIAVQEARALLSDAPTQHRPLRSAAAWTPHNQRMVLPGPDIRRVLTALPIADFATIRGNYTEMLPHLNLEWSSEASGSGEAAPYATHTIQVSVTYRGQALAVPLTMTMFRADRRYSTNHHVWVPVPDDGKIHVHRVSEGQDGPLPRSVELGVSIIGLRGGGN